MVSRDLPSITTKFDPKRFNGMWKKGYSRRWINSYMPCQGCLAMIFRTNNQTTKQQVYFCDKVTRKYFRHKGCSDLNILSISFPFAIPIIHTLRNVEQIYHSTKTTILTRPTKMP